MKVVLFAVLALVAGAVLAIPIIGFLNKTGKRGEGEFKSGPNGLPVQNGPWVYWYNDSQKEAEGEFKMGVKVGKWTYYHENGQRMLQGTYNKKGEREGLWTEWYDTGHKNREGNFTDDLESGKWTFWYENGFKRSQGDYYKGKQVGKWTYYDEIEEGVVMGTEDYPDFVGQEK